MSNAVPEGWDEYSFNDVFSEIKNGCSLDQNQKRAGVAVTRIETISEGVIDYEKVGWLETDDDISRYKIEEGDILLSHINSMKHIGKSALKTDRKPLFHGMNLLRMKVVKPTHDYRYVHQLLSSESVRNDLRQKAKQAINQASLNVQDIKSCKYPIPPLPEQQKIAAILSSVDDVIDKTQAQIDKLKDLKIGMMQELLTKGIGHTEFKDSPVGRIPVGWDVSSIGSVAKLTSGGTPNRERADYWGGNIPWVKTGEINYATIFSTEENITEEGLKGSSAKIVPIGAVLMAMYGQGVTRGKVAILGVDSTMNQACLAMIPSDRISNYFLYYFLTREYENLRSLVQEGAQKNLSATIVKEVLIPIPPLDEQKRIVGGLKSLDQKLDFALGKVTSMKNLKKALMQDLLTGTVRVKVD